MADLDRKELIQLIAIGKSNLNLTGLDLSYLDLKKLDLTGAILIGANLSYTDLSNVILKDANMQEVNLTGAILTNANFENADLKNAIFQEIDENIKQINYDQLKSEEIKSEEIKNINEEKSYLRNITPKVNTNINKLIAKNKQLEKLTIPDENPELEKQELLNMITNYEKGGINKVIDFSEIDLSGLDLSNRNLAGINLSGTDLIKTNLSGSNLMGANLSNADLTEANLINANLTNAQLKWATFNYSDLTSANMTNVDALHTDFSDSNLSGALLLNANLKMAYFKNSNLKNVNLKNTNLRKTNFLTSNLISSDIIIDENDISLENLIKLEKLSFKTITFCLECGFITLNCINQYINDFGSFIYLTEIDKETENKLLQISKRSNNFQITNLKESRRNKNPLDNLNNLKLDILKNYFDYSYSKLSIRAQNGLISLVENKDIIEIIKIINEPKFEFDEIKNIGDKTLKELKKWKLYLINYLDKIYSTSNNVLRIDYFKWLLKNIFPKLPFNFFSELDLYFLDNEKINLFKILILIFNSNKILDSKRALIFNNIFINIDKLNNSIIANKLNLSRERIRQLQSSLENELIFKLKPLNRLYQLNYFNYNFELNKSLIVLDNDLMIKINTKENVNFNLDFISLIYCIFLNETHNLLSLKLSGEKKVIFNKKYLIKKKFYRHFNFEDFFTKMFILTSKKNNYTHTIKKIDIINEFLTSPDENIIEELDYICSIIIKHEFNIKINNEYFIINRNTKKELYEYIYEILDERGKMKKVEEIHLEIKKKTPELNVGLESVRSTLQKDKERFVYFGRSSTYGLKKWENELDNFKGGTIRKIAIEYLNAYSSPKHISEISKHILKYRSNSNEYSILQNLKLEENGVFIFFTNGYIGLSAKIYANSYTKITDVPAIEKKEWKDRFLDLEFFYKKYKKLPSSTSGNDMEVKLYRWLSIQKKKLENGSLNDNNKILLEKILTEIY
jgi:uncharacterized protein YjbI with pentapeptide repeats